MKAPKVCIVLVAFLALSMSHRVCAGQQSLLDPYASIQAPSSKSKTGKSSASKSEEKKSSYTHSALTSSEASAEVNTEQKETKPAKTKRAKKEKELTSSKVEGEEKAAKKSHATTSSSDTGVLSGINEIKNSYVKTFKAAGSGIVNGTKAVGSKMAGGTKRMRDGVASGAQAIGHGFKVTGGKVKNGASSVGNKVAAAPSKLSHSDKSEGVKAAPAESESQAVTEKVLDDASSPGAYAGKPLEPLSTKPLTKGGSGGSSVFGRTFGKLNVFGHGKKQQPNMARPRAAAATQMSQPFTN
jgi:hypothetical protein